MIIEEKQTIIAFSADEMIAKKIKKMKRGFATKCEALDWERHFLLEKASSLDMTFGDFYKRYKEDVQPKIRENTWRSKEYVIEQKMYLIHIPSLICTMR